jgi:hypothetical protein
VTGGIVENPVKPDIADPRLGALLLQTWALANAAASREVDDRYHNVLTVTARAITDAGADPGAFGIFVRNTGSFPIHAMVVAASLVAAPGPGEASVLARSETLAPGDVLSTGGAITPPPGKHTVTAVVLVTGLGPDGSQIQNIDTHTFPIEIQP